MKHAQIEIRLRYIY